MLAFEKAESATATLALELPEFEQAAESATAPLALALPVAALALAVLVPPIATVLGVYLLRTRGLGRRKRSSDAGPVLDQLVLRLQAALLAEQKQRLRILLIASCTAWLAFCGIIAHRVAAYLLGQRYLPENWQFEALLGPLFFISSISSLRATDRTAMYVVSVLVIGFVAHKGHTVCRRHTRG